MPIKNLWFNYKIECLEIFLSRAFEVNDEYTRALEYAQDEFEHDHAVDILLGYQDIVFKAVYSELNALVELELKNLVRSILREKGQTLPTLNRGNVRPIIEQEYNIGFEDLPGFNEVDEIRKVINAFKHDDGFSGEYEETFPGMGLLFGYRETRYKLDWDKTYQSIQAVKEFMRALPGERQRFPESRPKPEDESTVQARQRTWDKLKKRGLMGHQIGKAIPVSDERGGYSTVCELCGKSFWAEHEEILSISVAIDRCPGLPELTQGEHFARK